MFVFYIYTHVYQKSLIVENLKNVNLIQYKKCSPVKATTTLKCITRYQKHIMKGQNININNQSRENAVLELMSYTDNSLLFLLTLQ